MGLSINERKEEKMKNGLDIVGHGRAVLRNESGKIQQLREFDNVFTDVGDAHVADQMASSQDESAMSDMSIGTSATTLTAGDTTLGGELDRNTLTSFTQGASADDNKVVYVGDWAAADGTGAITEAGIFNSHTADSGTMLCAQTFSVINKGASDTLQITCLFESFYRKVKVQFREFGEYLFETIPSQASLLGRACVETMGGTTLWVEDIVRTIWRHIELGRNDLALVTKLGL
ncbi:MAG: hypothetical protein U9O78_04315 [Patescibacteria group bacterium]|nr:hypothetical protein [Patescibacteria group bacterium]